MSNTERTWTVSQAVRAKVMQRCGRATYRVFCELIRHRRQHEALLTLEPNEFLPYYQRKVRASEIAIRLDLSDRTIIRHFRRLEAEGIVCRGGRYSADEATLDFQEEKAHDIEVSDKREAAKEYRDNFDRVLQSISQGFNLSYYLNRTTPENGRWPVSFTVNVTEEEALVIADMLASWGENGESIAVAGKAEWDKGEEPDLSKLKSSKHPAKKVAS
jgi:DNA-binding Lrp family transcriptional regulator